MSGRCGISHAASGEGSRESRGFTTAAGCSSQVFTGCGVTKADSAAEAAANGEDYDRSASGPNAGTSPQARGGADRTITTRLHYG